MAYYTAARAAAPAAAAAEAPCISEVYWLPCYANPGSTRTRKPAPRTNLAPTNSTSSHHVRGAGLRVNVRIKVSTYNMSKDS